MQHKSNRGQAAVFEMQNVQASGKTRSTGISQLRFFQLSESLKLSVSLSHRWILSDEFLFYFLL
jgi:hypothetical protein